MKRKRSINIKWVHTSDFHGDLFGYNYQIGKSTGNGLQAIYSYVCQKEREDGERLIVTDGGDCLQGQPVAYCYNFIDTQSPHLVAEVMNEMGYVCGVMGNHDIEVGKSTFERWKNDCWFPILGANVFDKKTGKPYLQPYHIVNRCGVKVAILGFVTPVIPYYQPESLWKNLSFEEIISCAEKWVKYIQEKENPDILAGIFHSGYDGGFEVDGICRENTVKAVAEQIPGFDIILYGHDHVPAVHRIKNVNGNEVICLGAVTKDGYFAEVDIKVIIQDGKIISKVTKGRIRNIAKDIPLSFHHSELLDSKFAHQIQKVSEWAKSPLCDLPESLAEQDTYFGTCPFMDYIHHVQLEMTGADISLAAPFAYNSQLRKGTLTIGDLFPLLGYEEFVYKVRMTGQEILNLLEYSYGRWVTTMQQPEDHLLLIRKRDANVRTIDKFKRLVIRLIRERKLFAEKYLSDWALMYSPSDLYSAAGIIYTVDVTKSVGSRITIYTMADGAPFLPDLDYNVAVNRRLLFDKSGAIAKGARIPQKEIPSRIISISEKALPYYMMNMMASQKNIHINKICNWRFVPNDLVSQAANADRRLLFQ